MSKLEKMDTENASEDLQTLCEVLNAAIDRINELEAKYEGHTHNGVYGAPPIAHPTPQKEGE